MNLKEIRARLEMTQAEFADSLGISLRALQSYEQGWRKVPNTVIRLITLTFNEAYNECWRQKEVIEKQLKKQLTYHIRTTKSMRNERDFYKKRYIELEVKVDLAFSELSKARINHNKLTVNHELLKTKFAEQDPHCHHCQITISKRSISCRSCYNKQNQGKP